MLREIPVLKHRVNQYDQDDGTIILTSGLKLGPVVPNTCAWLRHWSVVAPDRVFLAQRSGAGWREVTYAEALDKVRGLAAGLLAQGMSPETPILIISGNGVDHGLLMLAAQYIGIPTIATAEQYALLPAAHERLKQVVDLIRPAMVFADDAARYRQALDLPYIAGLKIVSSRPDGDDVTSLDSMLRETGSGLDLAHAQVGPETIAKYLMTSGSTSAPKAVETTQRMLCINQAQIVAALPLLQARPPRILDWLPWNHTFGGSHNFNMMLANGGSLYIDDGKPVKGLFERSLENLRLMSGTISFNVPIGFAWMRDAFRDDAQLRNRFFEDLDMMFYAGASLPQDVWRDLEAMARDVTGKVPLLTSSWGLTETAPAAVLQYEPPESAGIIGVPLPEVSVKLLPQDDARYEIRVKGPSIMERYHRAPQKTDDAFDADGYFITGDAVKFLDPENVQKGLRFDGRISEDFKLLTGTWVRAATLRLSLLAHLAPLVQDLIIAGRDRNDIGLLLVPNREETGELVAQNAVVTEPILLEQLRQRLADFNSANSGSSARIARALVLAEPPSFATGEMTAKGNLNFNKILQERAHLVEQLYTARHDGVLELEQEA